MSLPSTNSIVSVDLFCGAGGLTHGLELAGVNVVLGVDLDPACAFPYEHNNKARFVQQSVEQLSAATIRDALKEGAYSLLAGCAPCQPFSRYRLGKSDSSDGRWNLLRHFQRMVEEVSPTMVTMENVPRLAEQRVFMEFVSSLEKLGYRTSHQVVACANYGVPQQRERLVLLASKLGPIELIAPTHPAEKHITVRKAIGKLPPIRAGEADAKDSLHQACSLSPINMRRMRASKPGGSWRDWQDSLVAECHRRSSGKTYPSVYGRMVWDDPAPTMTTQFFGFGNGRFGHPEQNRAISLREGAILQSFPKTYRFVPPDRPIYRKTVGRLIGNAVPVKLGEAIGKSIVQHVAAYS